MSWRDDALCQHLDPAIFFPAEASGPGTVEAAARAVRPICNECPVSAECLTEGIAFATMDGGGLWAGTTPRQRRTLARTQQLVSA